MFTVTFYSFRGGVGRTMALANVAYHLAKDGYRVFLIDFDLEAPGLSLIPDFMPVVGQEPKTTGGLIAYLQAGVNDEPLPAIETLAYETRISIEQTGKQPKPGTIHILPTGTQAEQKDDPRAGGLKLDRIYETVARSYVPDALKIEIEKAYQPDYLLVDSRTGMTEVGGICTVHLADLVVVLSGLNQQNVIGTCFVLRRLADAQKDFAERVLFVASPVPVGEEELKANRIDAARHQFAEALGVDFEKLPPFRTLPYHPRLALSEDSFLALYPDAPLSHAYRQLAGQLQSRNPNDGKYRFAMILKQFLAAPSNTMEEFRALAASPSAPVEALVAYAYLLSEIGRKEEAEEYYRRAVEADPKNANNLGSYAVFLEVVRKDADRADEFYRRAIDADPRHVNNLGNYARFLEDVRKDADRAEEFYRRAIDADPKRANNLGNYARFLHNVRKDADRAEEFYRRAVDADPKHAINLANYARFLDDVRKDADRAEEFYKRAVDADPKQANNLGNYAVFLKNVRKDADRAEEFYQRAIDADPKHANNLGNYANFLKDVRKDADRAEEFYQRAIDADPKHANNLGNYAVFLKDVRKDADRAEEFYKRAIDADPKQAINLANYARFLDDVRKDADQAEEFYKRAIDADPKHALSLGNYGWLLYKVRDDVSAALDMTERALALDPQATSLLSNRGLFLLLLGRVEEARNQYEQTLAGVADADGLRKYCLADLEAAMKKSPQNAEIAVMLDWVQKRWQELHAASVATPKQ